ncbi:hypothetical protein BH09PLA1_BH09PLA1_14220 [soil metagenome]
MTMRWLILLLCIAAAGPTSQPAPATQPDYFAMSSDEFAACEAAKQIINFDRPDQTLLSAGILHETNRWRAREGRSTLSHHPKVDDAAMMHVRDMVAKNYLAHAEKGTKTPHPIDRVRAAGLAPILVAENIGTASGIQYKGGEPVFPLRQWRRGGLSYRENGPAIPPHTYRTFTEVVVKQWIDSPTHRENIMLRDAKYLGAACLPAIAKGATESEFHKFYTAQVLFTPSRFANDEPRAKSNRDDDDSADRARQPDAAPPEPPVPDPIGEDPKDHKQSGGGN